MIVVAAIVLGRYISCYKDLIIFFFYIYVWKYIFVDVMLHFKTKWSGAKRSDNYLKIIKSRSLKSWLSTNTPTLNSVQFQLRPFHLKQCFSVRRWHCGRHLLCLSPAVSDSCFPADISLCPLKEWVCESHFNAAPQLQYLHSHLILMAAFVYSENHIFTFCSQIILSQTEPLITQYYGSCHGWINGYLCHGKFHLNSTSWLFF